MPDDRAAANPAHRPPGGGAHPGGSQRKGRRDIQGLTYAGAG